VTLTFIPVPDGQVRLRKLARLLLAPPQKQEPAEKSPAASKETSQEERSDATT
jgi:hypothetical protein